MTTRSKAAEALRPVEALTIQTLVDNVTDTLSTNPEPVCSEMRCHVEHGLQVISGRAICCAHHGLSLVVKAHGDAGDRTILFDAGPEDYAVERNGARLGVDFGSVHALVLSHGHWDHAGGMLEAVHQIRRARDTGPLPCYLHPGMFRERGAQLPSGKVLPMAKVPSPDDYRRAGAEPVVTREARAIAAEQFFVSGEIPRVTSYETGLAGHVARDEAGDGWQPDPDVIDERFVAAHLRDKGLVVLTACSHAGLINVLTEAQRQFPDVPLYAVVGGFHLSGAKQEALIEETVLDLARFDLRWIVPSHCTGWRAVHAMVDAFGDERVVPNAVGKRFRL